jgi:hypothetical protein
MGSSEGDERFTLMWRDLGFYCDFCEEPGRWRFIGSHSRLLKFRNLLDTYARGPSNSEFSEASVGPHDHFGPYMHLTITTLTPKTWGIGPKILDCEIWGRIRDIEKLPDSSRGKSARATSATGSP